MEQARERRFAWRSPNGWQRSSASVRWNCDNPQEDSGAAVRASPTGFGAGTVRSHPEDALHARLPTVAAQPVD